MRLWFSAFCLSRERTQFLIPSPPPPPPIVKEQDSIMTADTHLPTYKGLFCNAAIGAAAGIIAATFLCPFDVIKTIFQVHGLPSLACANIKDASQQLFIGANMDAASGAGAAANPIQVVKTRLRGEGKWTAMRDMLSSFMHCYPCKLRLTRQVVRLRLQEQGHHSEKQYSGVIDCIKIVFEQEGIPCYYCGCVTNLVGITPSAVITFTGFEMIQRFLVNLYAPDTQPIPKTKCVDLGSTAGRAIQIPVSRSRIA